MSKEATELRAGFEVCGQGVGEAWSSVEEDWSNAGLEEAVQYDWGRSEVGVS